MSGPGGWSIFLLSGLGKLTAGASIRPVEGRFCRPFFGAANAKRLQGFDALQP